MTELFLLRHGKVDGPAALYGHTDVAVSNENNEEMLQQLLQVKDQFTHIVSSPLKRCCELAKLFSSQSKLPLTIEPALQEISFGQFDGISFDNLAEQWQLLDDFWQSPASNSLPGSEHLTVFNLRINKLLSWLLKQYQNESVLLICHGGVIRMLLSIVLDLDWKNPKLFSSLMIKNASISNITVHTDSQLKQVTSIGLPLSAIAAITHNKRLQDD